MDWWRDQRELFWSPSRIRHLAGPDREDDFEQTLWEGEYNWGFARATVPQKTWECLVLPIWREFRHALGQRHSIFPQLRSGIKQIAADEVQI